jgi:peptidoglycan/LPS O-acetylase OafA/YrhL
MDTKNIQRKYDLDWLRVIGILAVFIFHSTRFFDLGDWHVKSPLKYYGIDVFQEFLMTWMMPLIFLISGASIFYAMRKGGAVKFFKDKFLRLVVPLLVCVFTHASLQVYLERVSHHQFNGSYFEFLPHYFDGVYIDVGSSGNFALFGMHLWYLLFLFIYILMFYPLFRWLMAGGQRLLNGLGNILAIPGLAYLLFLPTFFFFDSVDGMADPGGWPMPVYTIFFFIGFVIASHPRLQSRILRMRWISLIGAVLVLAVHLTLMSRPSTAALFDEINSPLASIIVWFALLAFLGFGMKYLNFSTPFLSYANEAVLPFYILHQTVLLSVGFIVVQWSIPVALRWLIIAVSSFATIMLLYEYLVRRNNTLRFLFGMKLLPVRPVQEVRQAVSRLTT